MRTILQTQAAECGIACLAMIADHYGTSLGMIEVRRRFSVSLKGARLSQLMRNAAAIDLSSRAIRCEIEELENLELPCILHWDFNHFVVLSGVGDKSIQILDPARGKVKVLKTEVSKHFTGVVLELTPSSSFDPFVENKRLKLRQLINNVTGLKRTLVNIFFLAACLEIVALATPMVTQFIVDDALVTGDKNLLLLTILGGGILILIDFIVRMSRGWIGLRLNQQMTIQWTSSLLLHLLKLPMAFFESRHLGDITSRFASLGSVRSTFTSGAISSILDGTMAVATLLLMFAYSPKLSGIALVAVVLYAALRLIAFQPLRDATQQRIIFAARENSYFLESIRAVMPLKLNGRIAERLSRWQNLYVEVQNRDVATQRLTLVFSSANTLISGIEGMALLYVGGLGVLDRSLSLGMLLAFLSYKSQFASRTSSLTDLVADIRMLRLHGERLADIALEAPELDKEGGDSDGSKLLARIEVSNLSFRYAEGEPWILKNINFVVEPCESVAIVGPSGCGKTTLLKLLLGLLVPLEGEIRIGEAGLAVSIHHIGLSGYRSMVGAVMQDDSLLAGSIAENIACFDPLIDMERVEASARLANIENEINAMPMGYQSYIGDMGNSLSGGQKQRTLLARALYKRPRFLFLDEATSHLDVKNEQVVNEAVRRLSLTRLIIAHRPETIRSADRVIELELH